MMLQEKEASTPMARVASAIARAHRIHEEIDRATGDESSRRFLADAVVCITTGTSHVWFRAHISRYLAQSSLILSALRLRVADRVVMAMTFAQLICPSFDLAYYEARLGYLLEDMSNLEKKTLAVQAGRQPHSSLWGWLALFIMDLEVLAHHIQNEIEDALSQRDDH